MNKISSKLILFLIFSCFALLACVPQKQEVRPDHSATGLLWKISKPGVEESFLFGTVHSDDVRVTKLPLPVQTAFNQSDSFALEVILDEVASKSIIAHMYYADGTALRDVVGDDLYKRSVAALSTKGLPEEAINQMKPWAVFTILNVPENETGLFLDALLYRDALAENKNVIGLETPLEQVSVFDDMELKAQIELLEKSLDHLADMQQVTDEIIEVYLSRDLGKILAINERYNRIMGEELAEVFNKRLLTDRNIRMAERMRPLLEQGDVFVGVGALHLPGDDGLITLLKQQGYTLEPVY